MRVRLLNVKYSPNVGDGLLVECLEYHLRSVVGVQSVISVDLAGRTEFGQGRAKREAMMWVLESLPCALRPSFARLGLYAKLKLSLRAHFRRELVKADVVIIGGGNLLSDHDLNFPMKLSAAMSEAAQQGASLAIYGCGVSRGWSDTGIKMFCAALRKNKPVYVALRDRASKIAWDSMFSEAAGLKALVVNDPGVLASTVYRFEQMQESRSQKTVGLGIMSTAAINYHGFKSPLPNELIRWYLDLINLLVIRDFNVLLFTNGSPEDKKFAATVWKSLGLNSAEERVSIEDVSTPADLARVVNRTDVVTAFRMHALVTAYSFEKPIAAMKWDPKVEAFLESVAIENSVVDANVSTAQYAADMIAGKFSVGADHVAVKRKIEEADQEIAAMIAAISLVQTARHYSEQS